MFLPSVGTVDRTFLIEISGTDFHPPLVPFTPQHFENMKQRR